MNILFIRKHQQRRSLQLFLPQQRLNLPLHNSQPCLVRRVNHENQRGRRLCVVTSPVRPDAVLSAQIPDTKRDVFVRQGLDVEAYCGDGGDDFADLQAVEDRCFTGVVEAQD